MVCRKIKFQDLATQTDPATRARSRPSGPGVGHPGQEPATRTRSQSPRPGAGHPGWEPATRARRGKIKQYFHLGGSSQKFCLQLSVLIS